MRVTYYDQNSGRRIITHERMLLHASSMLWVIEASRADLKTELQPEKGESSYAIIRELEQAADDFWQMHFAHGSGSTELEGTEEGFAVRVAGRGGRIFVKRGEHEPGPLEGEEGGP